MLYVIPCLNSPKSNLYKTEPYFFGQVEVGVESQSKLRSVKNILIMQPA